MIAAGVNAKALASYIGHASVTITFDLYGHLMPGNEEEAAGLLTRRSTERRLQLSVSRRRRPRRLVVAVEDVRIHVETVRPHDRP